MIWTSFELWLYLDGFAHRHPRLVPARVKRWLRSKLNLEADVHNDWA